MRTLMDEVRERAANLPVQRIEIVEGGEGQTFSAAFDEAMHAYQRERDEHVISMYEFTCQLATLEPPPPEMQRLFASIVGNQKAMDRFVQMNAGTISPAEFFSGSSSSA